MLQRLYIDGELMDIDDDMEVTLNFKSNLFRDITKLTSNYTYTIDLPKTVHNLSVLGNCDKPKSETDAPYEFHDAKYIRNGLEIISSGKATVLEVTDEDIEVSIYWGLFPAFTTLQGNNLKLNELSVNVRRNFFRNNEIDTYDYALAAGVFYADYNSRRVESDEDSWQGTYYAYTSAFTVVPSQVISITDNYVQPCVTCKWLLDRISEDTGVTFDYGTAADYIKSLTVPIILRQGDTEAFGGQLGGQFTISNVKVNKTSIPFVLTNKIDNVMDVELGKEVTKITIKESCTLYFSINMMWSFMVTDKMPLRFENGDITSYFFYHYYITMHVTHYSESGEKSEDTYIAGNAEDFLTPASMLNTTTGTPRFQFLIRGGGTISFEEHDEISFTLDNKGWFGLSSMGTYGLMFSNGFLSATVKDTESVPYGGSFPIGQNLPEIKVTDFIKTLCVLTGTYPLQLKGDSASITFIPFNTIWENRENAVDWTRKLIPSDARNKPRSIEFSLDGYCRHNRYLWKEDDTVIGNYDGDLTLDNDTLEYEQDVLTFPFAASDDNRIPIVNPKLSSDADAQSETSKAATDNYKKCQPRLMTLYKASDGGAALEFRIDLNTIFEEKYEYLRKTVEKPRVLTERFALNDYDILDFDETRPVYLAQYGAYYAVTELKVNGDSYTEATLLQLEF